MLKQILNSRKLIIAQIVILLVLTGLIKTLYYTTNDQTQIPVEMSKPTVETLQIKNQPLDNRVAILRDYLYKHNSPLQFYAQDLVDAADKNGIDWRLVAAISGVESTFGRYTPGSVEYQSVSYNGWGWGVYGTQSLYFKSWKDGIYTVSEGLGKEYVRKGLVTPYEMNRKYASSPSWGWKVAFFLDDIDKFADGYPKTQVNMAYLKNTDVSRNLVVTPASVARAYKNGADSAKLVEQSVQITPGTEISATVFSVTKTQSFIQ